ncbi:MAG: DUF2357 domain-containing protein [Bacilli bacterium]
MVTLYDLGVHIKFTTGKMNIDVLTMAESLDEMESSKLTNISFKEYENIKMEFTSINVNDKLYYDGIDLLPGEICQVDSKGNLYLVPLTEGETYSIFEYSTDYYAMRVGRFVMRLLHNEKMYYQWFSVCPKNVNDEEWTIMQQELEEEIQGLSSDIIRKNISLGDNNNEVAPSQELYKFFVIKRHFNSILAALIDLKDKPNYKVEKDYRLEPLYRATYIDNITVKDYLMKGTGEEKYLVPKRVYNYDLPENRWLKKIITIYENELKLFRSSTMKYAKYVEKEIEEFCKYKEKNIASIIAKKKVMEELKSYLETAKTILSISELIKSKEWYQEIREVDSMIVPHVLIYDVRYNAFYKMYKELRQNSINIKWDESYAYSWKLSSEMYEIWCFIKICRFLIDSELGFEAKGWIFDQIKDEHILVPELMSGTRVDFEKENFKIKAYYDVALGKSINKTDKENEPLYSNSRHVKPDIRLDLYKDDIYWCSLIIEVKYRTIKNFWNNKDNSCKEQIRAYKNDYKSKFCRGLNPEFVVRKINPVDRVWVFNPTHSLKEVIDRRDEGIKFVQLIPGENHRNILDELKKEISMAFDGELA